jgi:hypothetical protein
MGLGCANTKMTYRVYSMSNRSVDVDSTDFRVFLYDEDGRKMKPLYRFKSRQDAEEELDRLSDLLGLQIVPERGR